MIPVPSKSFSLLLESVVLNWFELVLMEILRLLQPWVSGATRRPRFFGHSGEARESAQCVEVLGDQGSTNLFSKETQNVWQLSDVIRIKWGKPAKTTVSRSLHSFGFCTWKLKRLGFQDSSIYAYKQVITEHWKADKDHDPTLQSEARGRRWTLSKNETWSAGCQSRLYLCEDSNCLIALLASIIWNFGNFCCIDMTPVLNKGNGVHQSVDRIHDLVTLGNKGFGIYLRYASCVCLHLIKS